jgi:hypothetical protein
LLRGTARAAGIILADARAAVRNSASRRVNDPVIGPLEDKREYDARSLTTNKAGKSQTARLANATT